MRLASWKEISKVVNSADVVVEVVDIRNPLGTMSRRLEKLVEDRGKELLVLLNKADLVPRKVAEAWKEHLSEMGYSVMYASATGRLGTRMVRGWIRASAPSIPFTVAVVGYPKTGKSSIINALRGRKGASTSPIPGSAGYTKGFQILKVEDGFYMIDSPGIIPVDGGWPEAVIRGMSPEEMRDPVPAALSLLELALSLRPEAVKEAYGIEERDPLKILEAIALSRGWRYKSSGEPLIEEAARTVIRDYHTAKLLFYTLPPEVRSSEGDNNHE